jgi:hypothetical protein
MYIQMNGLGDFNRCCVGVQMDIKSKPDFFFNPRKGKRPAFEPGS